MWNGNSGTWDDWERQVTLWTDSADTRQAPTLGQRLVRSLSYLPQVHAVGLSVPRVELVKNTGVDGADRHRSETAGNARIEHEAEGPSKGLHLESDSPSVTESWARH